MKKSKILLFRALIKSEILTSREVLYATLVRVISLCFAKKKLSNIRVFLALNVSSSEKKLTQHVSKDLSSFNRRGTG